MMFRWGRRPYLLFGFLLSSVFAANLASPLRLFMTFLYSWGKQSFHLKLQSASSTTPHCSGVTLPAAERRLLHVPKSQDGYTSENSGDVASSLEPLNIFHFIKLDRSQLRSVYS